MTHLGPECEISCKELKARLDRGENLVLLDVRNDYEFETVNLGGVLIPLAELPKRFTELDPVRETVVFCHHGGRSAMAVQFLKKQGFTQVKNLLGGIDEWAASIDPSLPRY